MNTSLDSELADVVVLTVGEAARVLRISRSLAYELAAVYETSGGMDGLPVLRLAGCLRVPKWALLELAMTGRVVRLRDATITDDAPFVHGVAPGACESTGERRVA